MSESDMSMDSELGSATSRRCAGRDDRAVKVTKLANRHAGPWGVQHELGSLERLPGLRRRPDLRRPDLCSRSSGVLRWVTAVPSPMRRPRSARQSLRPPSLDAGSPHRAAVLAVAVLGSLHGVRRRDDRQHRGAEHRPRILGLAAVERLVGAERLQHRVRGVSRRRRPARRPARPPAGVLVRARHVHARARRCARSRPR